MHLDFAVLFKRSLRKACHPFFARFCPIVKGGRRFKAGAEAGCRRRYWCDLCWRREQRLHAASL